MPRPAIVKLFQAYREQMARLTDLSDVLAREGHAPALSGKRLPADEVRELFEKKAQSFSPLSKRKADAFSGLLDAGDDLARRAEGLVAQGAGNQRARAASGRDHAELAPAL